MNCRLNVTLVDGPTLGRDNTPTTPIDHDTCRAPQLNYRACAFAL
jgi:hypothetical protein